MPRTIVLQVLGQIEQQRSCQYFLTKEVSGVCIAQLVDNIGIGMLRGFLTKHSADFKEFEKLPVFGSKSVAAEQMTLLTADLKGRKSPFTFGNF